MFKKQSLGNKEPRKTCNLLLSLHVHQRHGCHFTSTPKICEKLCVHRENSNVQRSVHAKTLKTAVVMC